MDARKLYWTDVIDDVIRQANLNGTGARDLVAKGLAFSNAITLHPPDGTMYWGDQTLNLISRAGLDGSDAVRLVSTPPGT